MPYLNVAEIETRLEIASLSYPDNCELITLPNLTHEGRTTHAVRIHGGDLNPRPGVFFIGGVHAREWGSSDILIHFVDSILSAYTNQNGLSFGGKNYTEDEIQIIVNSLDIFVFPVVNPDGKLYSQTVYSMWRKNRSPAIPSHPNCPGVDINRNYDFLWDFTTHFHPNANIRISDDPCNDTYHGTSPFSEPETRNVKWILDTYTNIRFFMDIHSSGQLLIMPWGDDEIQESNPQMNFRNATYDGQRGISGDAYGEYMFNDDKWKQSLLLRDLRITIEAVRGKSYWVGTGYGILYPTAGTSKDYGYSRHFADSSKPLVYSYLLEWGTEFQPPYEEMSNIILDVSAALTQFCLNATLPDIYIRNTLQDVGDPLPDASLTSPDILVSLDSTLDLDDILQEPDNPLPLGTVDHCKDNFSYILVRNRGGTPTDVTVTVSWVRTSSLHNLIRWREVGSDTINNVLPNSTRISSPLRWVKSNIPELGDYYLAATISSSDDHHSPQGPNKDTNQEYLDYLRQHNNVAVKTIKVVHPTCTAPVFRGSRGFFSCIILAIIYSVIIALLSFLALFSKKIRCYIKGLRFRIKNCRKGNSDPCIKL